MEKEKTASLPETGKQQVIFNHSESLLQESQDFPEPGNRCNQKQCHVSKLSDTAMLHLFPDSESAQASNQKRIEPLVESNHGL